MGSQSQQLHFVMIPLLSPGHLLPMIDMAKLLAQRHVIVTIVTTPHNSVRFGAAINRAIESGLPIRLLEVRFPSAEAGLPEGCESCDELPSYSLTVNFFSATSMLQEPVEKLIGEVRPRPSCILSDKHVFWTAKTAEKFQIPWIMFDGMSCFTQLCTEMLSTSKVHESVSDSDPFLVPGLPDPIEFTKPQLPGLFNPRSASDSVNVIRRRIRETEVGAYGVVINSFEELEKSYVDEFKKLKRDKVWCVGPLSLCNKDSLDKVQRGNNGTNDQHKCLNWLDTQKPGSVTYACLGSLSSFAVTRGQLIELALGLEASDHPFVWAVRAGSNQEEIEKWIVEDGFEERIKGRGLLIRGWAPQILILSHFAIGGFLTHCGWNSTIEGICAGVPLITWPLFAEQFFNEKLLVQVVKTGLSVGSKMVVQFSEEEKAGVNVKRDDVERAIKCIMHEGEEGENRRRKAREFAEKAAKAVEEGGSSHSNITLLIEDIMKQTNDHKIN
ncbi:Glycosyltransferase [Heracleum sosnowskyi]|uniref:Glycosyltransferase n=1 Tax=Heracleum sosnowskyi TaxID=360622 RepID=A0AAD8M871_9APIA|nr:Glycosyltransferase [Heracleum sosnowskyi]